MENRKPTAPPKTNPTTKYSTAISVPSFPQIPTGQKTATIQEKTNLPSNAQTEGSRHFHTLGRPESYFWWMLMLLALARVAAM